VNPLASALEAVCGVPLNASRTPIANIAKVFTMTSYFDVDDLV
jgi:hypothetical protein